MNRARTFFYVCLGLLCVVAAYHLGATNAKAQAPSNPVVASYVFNVPCVVTANGDVYERSTPGGEQTFHYVTNVFGGGAPTSAQSMSIGQLKAKYAAPAPRR